VIPRVLAGTLMLPVLTTLAVAVGILGGAIISAFQLGVASSVYLEQRGLGFVHEGPLDGP
jgi:ABC-type transporter Mla maintaining outer membrane lipid asymmetry permease subunit MlaE